MGKELVISASRHETKVAILEDDQLVEIYFQRANEYSLAGSIHKGRVTRVLPGMQSAFVNIGLERDAFLYVSDFFEDNEEYDEVVVATEEKASRAERGPERPADRSPEARPAQNTEVPAAPQDRTAGPSERSEEPEGRRGRRSRRRRARGRGFPESKYASVREEQPERIEPTPEPEANADFSVLPGESLAKYSRSGDDDPGSGEPGFEDERAGLDLEPQEAAAPESQSTETLAAEPAVEPLVSEPQETTPELSVKEPVAESGGYDSTVTAEADQVPAEQGAESAESADEPLEQVAELPDGAIPEEPASEEPPAEEQVAEAPAAEEVEPSRMPVSLTATLREQGYRYMHRVSRRMRRKMRNAAQPEAPSEDRPETLEAAAEPKTNGRASARGDKPLPSIAELLKEGQEILVQIAKEPLGQKGARITSHIALPGRYVVYMPTVEHMGVSRKIASDEERLRLKRILQTHRTGMTGGFIVRTVGEGQPEHEIASDMRFLFNLWLDIRQKAEARKAPALIHHDLDLVQRILRDQMTDTFKTVWVDNEEIYESALRFVERFQPGLVGRVKLYTRSTPIFDAMNISNELEKALRPKVWLKSGGYIVINQTEALVAVDVNTGKFVGKSNRLEDTIVKTNTEAVKEIVRQVRLRDLGGIIVVDFIDMDERKNRQKVMQALEEAMRADRAPNKILQFNDFGLVAITRKRVKQSLERTLCSSCPYCEGAGYVKSVETVIGEVLQEAQRVARAIEGHDVTLRVNPDVAKVLKSSKNTYLEELEETLGRPVIVQSDPLLQQEKFDLV
jgi:Rne/Rng family ribonuclease